MTGFVATFTVLSFLIAVFGFVCMCSPKRNPQERPGDGFIVLTGLAVAIWGGVVLYQSQPVAPANRPAQSRMSTGSIGDTR